MNKLFAFIFITLALVALSGCESKEEAQQKASDKALKQFFDNKTTHVRTVEEIRAEQKAEQKKSEDAKK